ncbi:hypothetical protein FB451DRAFT_1402554 [Mycena latifolia]|nr:hypothetical protein FB451DRAFT_1402554 [Mycena latifolia]
MVANGSRVVPQLNACVRGRGARHREMWHQRHKQLVACSPRARGRDNVEVSGPCARSEGWPPSKADSEVFLRVHADREDAGVTQWGRGRVSVDARDERAPAG